MRLLVELSLVEQKSFEESCSNAAARLVYPVGKTTRNCVLCS